MPIRACLFDFGGTLFSYGPMRPHFERLLVETARRHGVAATEEALRGAYAQATLEVWGRFLERPFYLHRELFGETARAFLSRLGVETPPEEGERFYTAQRDLGLPIVAPRRGAAETLAALRAAGLHLGIVSNIDDDQFHPMLERTGLAPLFDATTTSEEARSCKPHPAIFEQALSKAGDPEPAEVLFVGDSPEHDVAGANALGLGSVLIAKRAPEGPHAPRHVIAELRELLTLVGG